MLEKGRARRPHDLDGSKIIDPVYVEDNVKLKASTIGPNVSIETVGDKAGHSATRDERAESVREHGGQSRPRTTDGYPSWMICERD